MKIEDLLIKSGWCCPWAFFSANKGVQPALLAARLGVSVDTVRDWKRYTAQGRIACKNNGPCLKAKGALNSDPKGPGP